MAPAPSSGPRAARSGPGTDGAADGHAFVIQMGEAINRPLKTSENVARDIVHDIVSRRLRAGDRLPSEGIMLQEYGVSRQSLREALRLLEVQGIITLRRGPGGGPVVGHLDPANLGRMSTLYYHLAGATYSELLDAWVASEGILADRAARHPDREAVRAAMTPFIEQDEPSHVGDGAERFAVVHSQFHAVVGSFAGNRVMELSLQSIGQIVMHHVLAGSDPRALEEAVLGDHAGVAKAIAAGHGKKARSAMEEHIERMAAFYRDKVDVDRDDFIDWR